MHCTQRKQLLWNQGYRDPLYRPLTTSRTTPKSTLSETSTVAVHFLFIEKEEQHDNGLQF